jgi:hypothetical protein
MAKLQKVPTSSYHPGYGCAIFMIAILTFAGMAVWVIYAGKEQDRQISLFTIEGAPPLESPKPTAEEKTALKSRLADFSKTMASGQTARLSLSLKDLNALITLCGEAGLLDDRGSLLFTGMDAAKQELQADLHWQLNSFPFTLEERKPRFLMGKAIVKPTVEGGAFELHIMDVAVPGKTVSEGFMHNLAQLPLLGVLRAKPETAPTLASISSFQITPENTLVLEGKPLPKVPPKS